MDDPDLKVVDEEEVVGSGVGSADADVVESAVGSEGDHAGVIDAVGADAVVDLAGPIRGRGGLGAGGVGGGRGGVVRQGPVRAAAIVFVDELVEQDLERGRDSRSTG
ncbi:hypothetical protein ACWCOV_10105 [Kribbella sp. NPDC002412]